MIALAAVAVLLAAGLVMIVANGHDAAPQRPESPLGAVVRYDEVDCESGWVVPDDGQRAIPSVGYTPPAEAVRASGAAVIVTVQGTSGTAVVLQSVEVEVVRRAPPPAALFLRAGCASEVWPRRYGLDLDRPRPAVAPEPGTAGFPYRIDHAEPEQLIVTPLVTSAVVEWRLRLKWTSGSTSEELVLDDGGRPFRTAAVTGSRELCLDREYIWRPDC
ncbi:hypothetical protein ACTG9Q_22480 [Actinokineospora sp. 24-640]